MRLFVDTGQHRVLIDTAAGSFGESAPAVLPSVDHSTTVTGRLVEHMTATGPEPAMADAVIITHAHPDHVGAR